MADPFLSEIRMMAFTYPPRGWAFCDGQAMAIAQNQALFSLLGTTYGGNGTTTFNLPDLRGRAPVHRGPAYSQGQVGGEEAHTLTMSEVPGVHSHPVRAVGGAGTSPQPTGALLASGSPIYRSPRSDPEPATLSPQTVAVTGGEPHDNMQPYLAVPFCIALTGAYPSHD
ncbi:MAG TPA: tail fiber protein [Longimicrobiales bacterium]